MLLDMLVNQKQTNKQTKKMFRFQFFILFILLWVLLNKQIIIYLDKNSYNKFLVEGQRSYNLVVDTSQPSKRVLGIHSNTWYKNLSLDGTFLQGHTVFHQHCTLEVMV